MVLSNMVKMRMCKRTLVLNKCVRALASLQRGVSCTISLLPIGNWPQVASLTGQSPCIVGIGLWHAFWGATSALFIFLFLCLLACFICLPALITIACDRTVDRPVPSLILNHHGSGVAVVGTTRLPTGCPSTKGCFFLAATAIELAVLLEYGRSQYTGN